MSGVCNLCELLINTQDENYVVAAERFMPAPNLVVETMLLKCATATAKATYTNGTVFFEEKNGHRFLTEHIATTISTWIKQQIRMAICKR